MRLAISVFSVLLVGFASGTLVDLLTAVHKNAAFQQLDSATQLIIVELLSAAQTGELHKYIDILGFHNVLAAIDKLPPAEAHTLRQVLIKELQIEENQVTTQTPSAVGKRDIVALLNKVKQSPTFNTLSQEHQIFIGELLTAAENQNLTAFIAKVGYSPVLELMDVLPANEAHTLNMYLLNHIKTETAVGK